MTARSFFILAACLKAAEGFLGFVFSSRADFVDSDSLWSSCEDFNLTFPCAGGLPRLFSSGVFSGFFVLFVGRSSCLLVAGL